jgi:hypothetical protein
MPLRVYTGLPCLRRSTGSPADAENLPSNHVSNGLRICVTRRPRCFQPGCDDHLIHFKFVVFAIRRIVVPGVLPFVTFCLDPSHSGTRRARRYSKRKSGQYHRFHIGDKFWLVTHFGRNLPASEQIYRLIHSLPHFPIAIPASGLTCTLPVGGSTPEGSFTCDPKVDS